MVEENIVETPVLEEVVETPVLEDNSFERERSLTFNPDTDLTAQDVERVTISSRGMSDFIKVFGTGKETIVNGRKQFTPTGTILAQQIAGELNQQYPSLITYQGLLDGTAPWFDTNDITKNLPPKKRKLTNDRILTLFAKDEDGRPLAGEELNTRFEGFRRQIIPSTAGLASMVTGAKTGARVKGGPRTKLFTSLGGAVIGLLGGETGAKKLQEGLGDVLSDFPRISGFFSLGKERVYTPGQKAKYESGKTLGSFAPYLFPSWYVPATVDLGGATLANNILKNAERIANKIKTGRKVTDEELATQGVKELTSGRFTLLSPFKKKTKNAVPFSVRMVGIVERMLGGYGTFARTNPVLATVIEGSSAIGASIMAEKAEDAYPEKGGPRIAAELLGAAIPSVLIPTLGTKYIPAIGRALKTSTYDPFVEGGLPKVWQDNFEKVKQLKGILSGKSKKRTSANIYSQLLNPANYPDGKVPSKTEFEDLFGLLEAKTIKQREFLLKRKLTPIEKELFKNRVNWTAADAATGSKFEPIIVALQAASEATSPALSKQRINQQILVNDNYRAVIGKLAETGDPSLLRIAGEMSFDLFEAGHAARLEDAITEVTTAFQRIKGDDAGTNKELSIKLYETIDNLLQNARTTEKSLWRVLDDIEVTEFRNTKGEIIEKPNFITAWEDSLPRVLEAKDYSTAQLKSLDDFVKRISEELENGTGSLTLRDLREMRSLALGFVRDKNMKPQIQRLAGIFAESLYDDMASLPQSSLFSYDAAIAYSRSLNDTFTRTYKGPLNMKNRGTGALRVPPELMGKNLMSGDFDTSLLRQSELENLAEFARTQNLEGFESNVITLDSVRDGLLRNMLTKKVLNAQTNEINTVVLNNLLKDPVFEEFLSLPVFQSLKEDLSNADTAQNLLLGVRKRKVQEDKILKKNITFLNFLPQNRLPDGVKGIDSPAKIMGLAIESSFPVNALNNILAFVNGGKVQKVAGVEIRGGVDLNRADRVEARDAIKTALLENVFLKSDMNSGAFSPTVMYQSIFDSMKNTGLKRPGKNVGGVSLADWMESNKIMSAKELGNMKTLLDDMVKYEAMDQAGELSQSVLTGDTNAALDLYIKLAGSKLGATAASTMGAGADSLIVRSAGVRFLTTILKDMPRSMDMAFAGTLFSDPELMAAMVRTAAANNKPSSEKRAIGSRFADLLSFYGFRESFPLVGSKSREIVENIVEPAIENIVEPFTGEGSEGQSSSVVLPNQEELRTSFLTRQLEQQPQSGNPPTNNFASSASGSGNAGTGFKQMSQEQKYAALFPNDASGIGSLMS